MLQLCPARFFWRLARSAWPFSGRLLRGPRSTPLSRSLELQLLAAARRPGEAAGLPTPPCAPNLLQLGAQWHAQALPCRTCSTAGALACSRSPSSPPRRLGSCTARPPVSRVPGGATIPVASGTGPTRPPSVRAPCVQEVPCIGPPSISTMMSWRRRRIPTPQGNPASCPPPRAVPSKMWRPTPQGQHTKITPFCGAVTAPPLKHGTWSRASALPKSGADDPIGSGPQHCQDAVIAAPPNTNVAGLSQATGV